MSGMPLAMQRLQFVRRSALSAVRWCSARELAGEDPGAGIAQSQLLSSGLHAARSAVRLDSRQSSSPVRSAVPSRLASLGRDAPGNRTISTGCAARAAHMKPTAGPPSAHPRLGPRRRSFARRSAMDQQPPPDATTSPKTIPGGQHRVGAELSQALRRRSSAVGVQGKTAAGRCVVLAAGYDTARGVVR